MPCLDLIIFSSNIYIQFRKRNLTANYKKINFCTEFRYKSYQQIRKVGGVMNIPKKIQRLIDRREKLAMNLINVSNELDEWLEKNGADFMDSDLADSTLTGCMIYCEPQNAKSSVENYIEDKM